MANLLCPACRRAELLRHGPVEPDDASVLGTGKFVCGSCRGQFPIVGGVPYLGAFLEDELLSVMEISSYLTEYCLDPEGGLRNLTDWSDDLRAEYLNIQRMIAEARNAAGDGVDFAAFGYSAPPHWFSARFNEFCQFRDMVAGMDFRGKSVLDIGAGTGFDAIRFQSMGAQVTALEFNPMQILVGSKNVPEVTWVGGSVTRLPFPSECFDFVIANAALHHVVNLERGLDEMMRVLKCGGHLITMADSFGPDAWDEHAEVSVFNGHPAVLRGVNEQIPRLSRFLSPFRAHGDAFNTTVMTPIVHGLFQWSDRMVSWPLSAAASALGSYRGGLCIRATKTAATSHDPAPKASELIPIEDYVSNLTGRKQALTSLADHMPAWALDHPMLDEDHPKFRLLLGWRQLVPGKAYREAASEAHLFVSDTSLSSYLRRLRFRTPETNGPGQRTLRVSLNGKEIHSQPIKAGSWSRLKMRANETLAVARPRNLLSFAVSGGGQDVESNLFDVSPRRLFFQ